MQSTLLYIHGFGSDRNSRKFLNLKDYFGEQYNYDFIEWKNDSDIKSLIQEKFLKYKTENDLIIIGDSTGANFAYQLREIRRNTSDKLILTSPLLDFKKRISNFEFPELVAKQLVKINHPKKAMIIATRTDEVLDQSFLFDNSFNDVRLLEVNDGHRLEAFENYLDEIKNYIEN